MDKIFSVFVVECWWSTGFDESEGNFTAHRVFVNESDANTYASELLVDQKPYETDTDKVLVRVSKHFLH